MKAYIVVQDAAGREIHLPLDNYAQVQALVRPHTPRTPDKEIDIIGKIRLAGKSAKRAYSPGFVDMSVTSFLSGSGTVQDVAADLGIPASTLDKWVRDRCGSVDRSRLV